MREMIEIYRRVEQGGGREKDGRIEGEGGRWLEKEEGKRNKSKKFDEKSKIVKRGRI